MRDTSGTRQEPTIRSGSRQRQGNWLRILLIWGVLFVAIYSAASYLLGIYAQQQIERYTQSVGSNASMEMQVLQHDRGVWQSGGIIQVRLRQRTETSQPDPVLHVKYQIHHAIWPMRLATVTWEVTHWLKQGFAANDATPSASMSLLQGQGIIDWQGQYDGRFVMSSVQAQINDEHLALSEMKGTVHWSVLRQSLTMHWARATLGSQGAGVAMRDLVWRIGANSGEPWSHELELGQLEWPQSGIAALDLQLAVQFPQNSGPDRQLATSGSLQTAILFQSAAKAFSVGQYRATDITMAGSLSGLRTETLGPLSLAWIQISDKRVLERELQQTLRQLLFDGFDLNVSQFSARSQWANTQGQFQFSISSVPAGIQADAMKRGLVWSPYVNSQGVMDFQGLSPALAGLGMLSGMLVRSANGVKMSYSLSNGQLKMNGRNSLEQLGRLLMTGINHYLNLLAQLPDYSEDEPTMDSKSAVTVFPVSP